MKKVGLIFVSISALLLGACGNSTASEDGKLNIVTTFYPVYEFTKQVAGDEANVDLLVKAGTEVHDYEPSAKILLEFKKLMFLFTKMKIWETWVHDVEESIDTSKVSVIRATEGCSCYPVVKKVNHDQSEEGAILMIRMYGCLLHVQLLL